MSGHSHGATIRHTKRSTPKATSSTERSSSPPNMGGDPTMYLKRRYAIDQAREFSVPTDNIERASKCG